MSYYIVVINEQHTLLPQQAEVISGYGGFEKLLIPAAGLSAIEQRELAKTLYGKNVIFVSPVPLLMALVCKNAGKHYGDIGVMHNDTRIAKELPGGKIVHVVAPDGWTIEWAM